MRSNFGFQKEWLMFRRTHRFLGVILAIVGSALASPLMLIFIKAMINFVMGSAESSQLLTEDELAIFGDVEFMLNASYSFSSGLVSICDTALLIICLLLMNASGGEQKKRSTIIPMCSGLNNMEYLLPKFVLYPSVTFVLAFVTGILTGLISNALFAEQQIELNMIMLGAALAAVYLTFMLTVFMTLGICMGRPGIAVIITYLGQQLILLLIQSLKLTRFNPFSLYALVAGEMFLNPDFSLKDEASSIFVAVVLSVVISVVLFFLTYAVLNSKKINNREDKPQF